MNSRKTSWQIILAGLALTGLAVYIVSYNGDPAAAPGASPSISSPAAPDKPAAKHDPADLPSIVLPLLEDKIEAGEILRKLEEIEHFEDLKTHLQDLKQYFEYGELQQSLQKIEQAVQKMDSTEIRVRLEDQNKIVIRPKYEVPDGQWAAVGPDAYVYQKMLNPSDLESLEFSLSAGSYTVAGGFSEAPRLTLRAEGSISSRQTLADRVDVEVESENGETTISVRNPGASGLFNRLEVEATLYIPSDTKIHASTEGGHVNARNLSNETRLSTNGGHITLREIHGESRVKTNGGHIKIFNSGGNLSARTSGGHITFTSFDGSASAQTSGGHLYLKEFSGSFEGGTSAGNINASIVQLREELDLETSAGNIHIKIPSNTRAKVQLDGMSTTIDPAFSFTGEKNNGSVEGYINIKSREDLPEALPLIDASCSIGNVQLSAYDR